MESLHRAQNRQGSVEGESRIHGTAANGPLDQNEAQPARSGHSGGEHINSSDPAMDRRPSVPHRRDQLHWPKQENDGPRSQMGRHGE